MFECLFFFLGYFIGLFFFVYIEFFLFKLLYDEFQSRVGFSAALETWANHLVLIGLAFQWEFCNCLVDYCFYLGSLSMLQRCKCSFRCRSLLSFDIEKRHILLILYFKYYPLFFVYVTRSWESGVVFLTVWAFSFLWKSSSMWSCSFWPHLPHVCHPLKPSLWWPYLWHLKHLKNAEMYCSPIFQGNIQFLHLWL